MSVQGNTSVPSDREDKSEHLSSEDEDIVEVEGFQVYGSQEKQVKEMFSDHPDFNSDFIVENQQLKNAHMEVLLKQIETLSLSTDQVSLSDLYDVENTLLDLTRAGFKVEWLRKRLDESYVKKEKQKVSRARIKVLEKLVKRRKLYLSELESDLEKEKAAAEAAATVASAATGAKIVDQRAGFNKT